MFEGIKNSLSKLVSAGFASDKVVAEVLKDIQRSMLQSDVDVKLVFEFTNTVKKRIKEDKGRGATKREKIISIIYDTLVELIGAEGHKLEIDKKPFKILMVGLFGSGKTTTSAKLAKFFKKKGFKVALLALDTFRPAAVQQLTQLGEKVHVPVYSIQGEEDPNVVINKYKSEFSKYDIIIGDSAGRDALDDELRTEITNINKDFEPNQTLLVVPADLGQNAKPQAQEFHDLLGVTGVIITKTDGTARAGGALTSCSITGTNVKFIGTGENVDDLEEFDPKRYVSRLLGMGDLETLLEKAKEIMTEEKAAKMSKKLIKGDFTLDDFYEQLESMKKMGPLSQVMNMIPGMGAAKIPKDLISGQEENLKKFKFIMDSMTGKERADPSVINSSRMERIAKGSGTDVKTVKSLIDQYNKIKKMMKGMGGNRKMKKLMKQMGMGNLDPTKMDPSMLGM